jgi:hypothetical protein
MNRIVTIAVGLAVFLFSACSSLQSMSGSNALVKTLVNQFGVTEKQAAGGTGSSLMLAKEKLGDTQFGNLRQFVPGSDALMQSAKDQGAVRGPIHDKAGLESAYSRLGMDSEMVGKFNQVLGDYVGRLGGEPAKNMLAMALR